MTSDEKREYQRMWVARRKAEWFDGKVCAHCGSTQNLEMDHIDPSTKSERLKSKDGKRRAVVVWNWPDEERKAELTKCQALCRDCHRTKTQDEQGTARHGTATRYRRYKCRCDLCLDAKRQERLKAKAKRAA